MRQLLLLGLIGCAPVAGAPDPFDPLDVAVSAALDVLDPRGAGLDDVEVLRVLDDALGMTHIRYGQTHGGVPVWNGVLTVHLDADGEVARQTDHLVPALRVDTEPDLSAGQAIDRAVAAWGDRSALTAEPTARLWVMRLDDGDHLAWDVQLERLDGTDATSRPRIFVDAHTGGELWRYENLQTATGTSTYDGTVSFESYSTGGWYYLEDTTWNVGTFSNANTTSTTYYVVDADDAWTDAGSADPVAAHWAATNFLAYLDEVHGRSGLDDHLGPGYFGSLTGSGSVLSVTTDYGSKYNNAFWSSPRIFIGDGDGSTFSPLVSRDVVAHELAHGITQFTAGLVYANESGALNEANSDIFAAAFDLWRGESATEAFQIGEDCWTPKTSGDAMRYMDDPTADGQSSDYYADRYVGTWDSGGVHLNSGIANLAFYLIAQGGTHPTYGGKVTGIGDEAAMAIWFRALSVYADSGSTFSDYRQAMWSAAEDLYLPGGPEVAAVLDAWDAVGVE